MAWSVRYDPAVSGSNASVAPATGAVALAGSSPVVGKGTDIAPPSGALTAIGAAVALALGVMVPSGSATLAAQAPAVSVSGSGSTPVLLYTDIISGSATNGEYGAGSYLSLFGLNFGTFANLGTSAGAKVYIGGAEVANYRVLDTAVVNGVRPGFPAIQRIIVQVGSSAVQALTAGTAYAVSVVVNGVSSNPTDVVGNALQFTPQPGHFWFIDDVNGNDSTGVVDDITHPFKYEQNCGGGTGSPTSGPCLSGKLAPGDTFVRRGNSGNPISEQEGYYGVIFRWNNGQSCVSGTAPTGASGHGYVHFTAYPGPILGNACEDVYFLTPAGGEGGWQGSNSAGEGTVGQYWTLSNFRLSCVSTTAGNDAGPVALQNEANYTRFVNLDLQWPTTSGSQLSGAISGNAFYSKVFGCYIHNVAGGTQNHGIYYGGNTAVTSHDIEVGFCVVTNVSGSCLQYHDNDGPGCFYNMLSHHCWLETAGKYNIDLWFPGSNINFWNLVCSSSSWEGMYWNPYGNGGQTPSLQTQINVENCTFINNGLTGSGSSYEVCIANENGNPPTGGGYMNIKNNLMIALSGRANTAHFAWLNSPGSTVDNNVYWDYNGTLTSGSSADSHPIHGDPMIVSATAPTTTDVQLQAGSAAIGVAISASINPTNDLGMNPQPRSGQTNRSCGAFA